LHENGKASGTCTPDADLAQRLCAASFPDVALALFSKETPWTRAYVTANIEAWNASGGRSARARLAQDEEVLVVAAREPKPGGIVVTGAGATYDVIRWDGSCVTLDAQEITMKRPAQPRRATVPWRHLSETTRDALLAAPKVASTEHAMEKECKGETFVASAGALQKRNGQCARADAAFNSAIVEYVKAGGKLPPLRLP
jgi:hypothetical protein